MGGGKSFLPSGGGISIKGAWVTREGMDNRDGLLHHPLSFPLQSFGIFELSTLCHLFLSPENLANEYVCVHIFLHMYNQLSEQY